MTLDLILLVWVAFWSVPLVGFLTMQNDDEYPGEDIPMQNLDSCRGCGAGLLPENRRIADGCSCNSRRGINHGLVAKNTCTCAECDPGQTGGTRISEGFTEDEGPGGDEGRPAGED